MAVTYRNNVNNLYSGASVTIGAYTGLKRVAVVEIARTTNVFSATFNGQAMTVIATGVNDQAYLYVALLAYLIPNSLAAGTYVITTGGGAYFGFSEIVGVDETNPWQNAQSYTTGSGTVYSMSTPGIATKRDGGALGVYHFGTSTGPRNVSYDSGTSRIAQDGTWNNSGLIWHPMAADGNESLTVTWDTTKESGAMAGIALNPQVAKSSPIVYLSDYGVM